MRSRIFSLSVMLLLAFSVSACAAPKNSFCGAAKLVDNSDVFDKLKPSASPANIKKQFDAVNASVEVMAKKSPPSLAKDVSDFKTQFDRQRDLLASVSYDAQKIPPSADLKAQVDDISAKIQAPATAIDSYYKDKC